MVNLFNRKRILKNTQTIQKKRPSHPLLLNAAEILLERFLWSSLPYRNILILGTYNYIFSKLLQNHLQKKPAFNIIVQHQDAFFDSEFLPFAQDSFDCVFSFFDIQWINDVPGHLKQIQYLLKPQGLFSGVFIGGETFIEIKKTGCDLLLKMENNTDFSMNFMPTIHASDGASLLQRAGFSSPLSDRETKKYCHSWTEIHHILQHLYATGFMQQPCKWVTKKHAQAIKNITAIDNTIELIFLTALGTLNNTKTLNNTSEFPVITP